MKSKYIDFQGFNVYYEVRGRSKKVLIFIHGWTSSVQSWKYQLDSFPNYKVIAVDLPGNGKSTKDEDADYTMEMFADTVKALMDQEKIKKAVIIGHSMGFSVTEVIVYKYPECCAGICSVDGAHFELPEDEKEKEEWIQNNEMFVQALEKEEGRDEFINMLFLPDTPNILREEVFKISRQVPLKIGQKMIEAAVKDQKFWVKKEVNIPCLVIHTPAFQLTEEYTRDFLKMYPQTDYHEIEGVSHFLMLEMPYKVNQLLLDFFENVYR